MSRESEKRTNPSRTVTALLLIILAIIAGNLVLSTGVRNLSDLENKFGIQPSTPVEVAILPCTFEVFIVSGLTTAQNCGTGAILIQSTNASATISDAIGDDTEGGLVFIRNGFYSISGQITLKSNVTLAGEGNATVLQQAPNRNIAMIYGNGVSDVVIRDLTLDGNAAHETSDGTGQNTYLIRFDNSYRPQVRNTFLRNGYSYGYLCYACTDPIISNNIVANIQEDAIGLHYFTVGGIIRDNVVTGSSDVGITVLSTARTIIEGNNIHDISQSVDPFPSNDHQCISLQPSQANVTDTIISGNTLNNCPGYGGAINVGGASTYYAVETTISGNTITNCGGIYLAHSDFTVVVNNLIDTSSYTALVAYSPIAHLTVSGNVFRNIANASVDFDGMQALITGNLFSHVLLNSIQLYGTSDVVIAQNIFDRQDKNAIYLGSGGNTHVIIKDNDIYGNATYLDIQVTGNSSDVLIQGNMIRGAQILNQGTNDVIVNNDVSGLSNSIQDSGTGTVIEANEGYNPKGNIASPFVSSGNTIKDSGGASTPVNATTMTVWESPKIINIIIGSGWTPAHTLVIKIDGTQLIATTAPVANTVYSFTLNPGETFYIQYQRSQATFVVSGE